MGSLSQAWRSLEEVCRVTVQLFMSRDAGIKGSSGTVGAVSKEAVASSSQCTFSCAGQGSLLKSVVSSW